MWPNSTSKSGSKGHPKHAKYAFVHICVQQQNWASESTGSYLGRLKMDVKVNPQRRNPTQIKLLIAGSPFEPTASSNELEHHPKLTDYPSVPGGK